MYQTGIMTDPTETLRNMAEVPKYGPDNPPRLRKPGESVEEYREAMGWGTTPPNDRVEGPGAASSRTVHSHDGFGGADNGEQR